MNISNTANLNYTEGEINGHNLNYLDNKFYDNTILDKTFPISFIQDMTNLKLEVKKIKVDKSVEGLSPQSTAQLESTLTLLDVDKNETKINLLEFRKLSIGYPKIIEIT